MHAVAQDAKQAAGSVGRENRQVRDSLARPWMGPAAVRVGNRAGWVADVHLCPLADSAAVNRADLRCWGITVSRSIRFSALVMVPYRTSV
jgi:hypothetical protein